MSGLERYIWRPHCACERETHRERETLKVMSREWINEYSKKEKGYKDKL